MIIYTSVKDMNKNLYNLLQNNSHEQSYTSSSTQQMANILHDMLKSFLPSISNNNDNNFNTRTDSAHSSLAKSLSVSSQSLSTSHSDYEIDQMISSNLSKQLKTMNRSSSLFRRTIVAIMQILLTSPSPSTNLLFNQIPPSSSSIDLELPNNSQNPIPYSTFDLDVEAILDFERTTFGDCSFNIHDLPNL
ncbi:unnamed protein product [Rotaria sp. Silwood2]|nr:unnamed protein product [Rotaria sp. Silwood2]CAF3036732.1 unnamed protein product [Rotaria sp. Silwood2]CAF3397657.1 unnamed protein product [Rotaria sp. Silwood2]CAF3495995.1 unnamed protein product [Rotaria sp. Silwood2]CAF3982897.1 unnamed protein product [Rotaria sp. Silwood2]